MKALGAYLMRGPTQAAGVAALLGALSWLFPPASTISGAAVGLVALRQGPRQGLIAIMGAAVLTGIVAVGGIGSLFPTITLLVAIWLPTWLCAQVLRVTHSQGLMLLAIGTLAGSFAMGTRIVSGDVREWWRMWSQRVLEQMGSSAAVFEPAALDRAAALMNAIAASGIAMNLMITLLLARWWQAVLYNPGGFQKEFHQLWLPRLLAVPVAIAAVFEVVSFMRIAAVDWLTDLLFVAAMLYLFQGLAITHHYLHARQRSVAWLVGLYAALLLVWPHTAVALATVGLADSVTDFRGLRRSSPVSLDKHDSSGPG